MRCRQAEPMNAAALAQRYAQVLSASWRARADLTPAKREPLERQFLPATLEIIETPAPALAHGLLWSIVVIVAAILLGDVNDLTIHVKAVVFTADEDLRILVAGEPDRERDGTCYIR